MVERLGEVDEGGRRENVDGSLEGFYLRVKKVQREYRTVLFRITQYGMVQRYTVQYIYQAMAIGNL